MNGIEIWMEYNEIEPLEVPSEMRHEREPLRRSSGSYEGSFYWSWVENGN